MEVQTASESEKAPLDDVEIIEYDGKKKQLICLPPPIKGSARSGNYDCQRALHVADSTKSACVIGPYAWLEFQKDGTAAVLELHNK